AELCVRAPGGEGLSPEDEKARIRRMEQTRRDQQLATESVRRFIQAMERPSAYNGRFVSVFDLMRDGESLARALRGAATEAQGSERLGDVIRPYVQVVDTSKRCTLTGIRLIVICRYFRHTCSNQYQSV